MGLFHEVFFCKIHKNTPVAETLFNKVAGVYPATSMKKGLPHRCFLMNVTRYLRHLKILKAPLGDCLYSTEKYFTNKKEKNPLRKEKNMEVAFKKNNDTRRTKT